MKKGQHSQADARPEQFEIKKLFAGKNTYELVTNDDITEGTVTDPVEGDGEPRKQFSYSTWRGRADLDGYEDAAAALIALKYTFADEFALLRKGQANPDDEEYTAYLAFVNASKTFAKEFFGEAER